MKPELVTAEMLNAPLVAEIVKRRAARVDALGIDRSLYKKISLFPLSPHAAERERIWREKRGDITEGDKVAAWRDFFAMTEDYDYRLAQAKKATNMD